MYNRLNTGFRFVALMNDTRDERDWSARKNPLDSLSRSRREIPGRSRIQILQNNYCPFDDLVAISLLTTLHYGVFH